MMQASRDTPERKEQNERERQRSKVSRDSNES